MKRLIAVLLLIALILCGCSSKPEASFYYCRANFQEEPIDSIIGSEKRDITGHEHQLSFLISLYLMGPSNKDLINPFPADVQLLGTQVAGNNLTVTLTDMDAVSDSRFTVASACMALTCFEISNYENVTVISGKRTITMNSGMLTLHDSGIPVESTIGG